MSPAEPQAHPHEHHEGHPRRWLILTVLCTSLAVVIIGNSSLNVALPTISRELKASTSQLQWIVDSYALVFAGLLFAAGSLGDKLGRKGALQIGLLVFGAAAVAASTVDSATPIIVLRGVMGLGAAFVMPATLSIIVNVFPVHERAKAIAMWTAIAGVGGTLGPIGSGLLLEHYSWSSVFLVNVPVVVIALAAGAFLVPTSRDPGKPSIDVPGALLSTAGIVGLVYAIIEAPEKGWTSAATLGIAAASLAVLAIFGAWELRTKEPMLDLRYFRHSGFAIGSLGMSLVFFAMFGFMFLLMQYMQLVLGFSALSTALRMLPFVFVMLAVSPRSPHLVERRGANRVVGAGLLTVASGMALLSRVQVSTGYWMLVAVMSLLAVGMALSMAPMTNAIMSGVPRAKAGVGSAMNDTSRELGGALGVAVLGSIVTSQYTSSLEPSLKALPPAAAEAARDSLAGALGVAAQMGPAGADLVDSAQKAFVDGMGAALIVGAALIAVAAFVARRLLPADVPTVDAAHLHAPADAPIQHSPADAPIQHSPADV